MSKTIVSYKNEDVSMTVKLNFSLTEWEKIFAVEDDQKVMRNVANEITSDIDARFASGGGRIPWKPKRALTTAFEGGSSATLIYTSELRKSILWLYSGGDLVIYTKKQYARVQNYGARFHTTKKQTVWLWANLFKGSGCMPANGFGITIPARPFMYFTDELVSRVKAILLKHIRKSERLG